MTLISLSLLLLLLVLLAWFRPPLLFAAILLMLHLATSAFFLQGPWLIVFPVVLTVTLLILVVPLRRQLLTRPIFSLFRRLLPPMSATEREALEAGTVWWDKEFFSGRPNWRRMLAEPVATLSPEEQAFMDGPVEELCGLLNDWEIVHDLHDLPSEAWRVLKEKGFFGMIIPKEYGGLGFSALAHSTVIMKLASRSVTAAVTAMVPNSLGPAELLLHYGTQEQKNHYLPRLARGIEVPCFALTGPDAGSDAASIPDFGIVCRGNYEGKELLGIRLTFDKRYITLAPVATVIGLAFQLRDPDHLLGAVEELGITCALVPAMLPGITIGSRHDPLGVPFQNGPIWGKEVFIPVDFIIGGVSGAGQGWKMLMESLAAGRGISLPALSTGAGKLVCRGVGGHARIRKQFNLPIGRFEGVEEALARIAGSSYLLDAARIVTCGAIDQGMKPSVISAIVKYHSTERMRQIVNDGMDVSGGNGICLGARNYLGHPYQSAPIGITVEGANILTRTMIIFGQGLIRCHPYIRAELEGVANRDRRQGLITFDSALWGHISFLISTKVRTFLLALTAGQLARVPGGPLRPYYRRASRLAAAFALTADISMLTLAGNLKRKEKLTGRLADMVSNLYLLTTLLKHFEDQGRPREEWPLFAWGAEDCLHRTGLAFAGFLANFPIRPVAWILRLIAFPFGIPDSPPSDRLGHRAATLLLEPSTVRDRLTAGIFIPTGTNDPLGRIDDALPKVIAAEPLEKKLRDAVRKGLLPQRSDAELVELGLNQGVITASEASTLRLAITARREVVRVDDFAKL